ncbi:MAG TPA: hypothetical protein VF987_07700 [Rhodospirillales bacterium]
MTNGGCAGVTEGAAAAARVFGQGVFFPDSVYNGESGRFGEPAGIAGKGAAVNPTFTPWMKQSVPTTTSEKHPSGVANNKRPLPVLLSGDTQR